MVEAIASGGSMASAAADLGLSQPEISKAIADLETATRPECSSRQVVKYWSGVVVAFSTSFATG